MEKFIPKTDIEEYLTNGFNLNTYKELTEDGEFKGVCDPLYFINLLWEQIEFFIENKYKPLTVKERILNLNLNRHALYFFIERLEHAIKIEYYDDSFENSTDDQIDICLRLINNEYKILENEFHPEYQNELYEFNFDEEKKYIETLDNYEDKIKHLITRRTEYFQSNVYRDGLSIEPFDHLCNLEIKKLKKIRDVQNETNKSNNISQFKLSNTKGAKIDLIRILNAVYGLGLIDTIDVRELTKKEFFESFGNFLGVDLSTYDADLSQALNVASEEANLKVFYEMIKITQDNHYLGIKKKRK